MNPPSKRWARPGETPARGAIPENWRPDLAREVRRAASEIRHDYRFKGIAYGDVRARFIAGAVAALSLRHEPAPYPDPGHAGWVWASLRMHAENLAESWDLARVEVSECHPLLRPGGVRYMAAFGDPPLHCPEEASQDWVTAQVWAALNAIQGADRRWVIRAEAPVNDEDLAAAISQETALRGWRRSGGPGSAGYQTAGTAALLVFCGDTELALSGTRLLDLVRAIAGIRRPDGTLPALPSPTPMPLSALVPPASPRKSTRRAGTRSDDAAAGSGVAQGTLL